MDERTEKLLASLSEGFQRYSQDVKKAFENAGREFAERNPEFAEWASKIDWSCDEEDEPRVPFGFIMVEERGRLGRVIEIHVSEVQAYMDNEMILKGKDKPLVVEHDKDELRAMVLDAQMDWAKFELFKAGKLFVEIDATKQEVRAGETGRY